MLSLTKMFVLWLILWNRLHHLHTIHNCINSILPQQTLHNILLQGVLKHSQRSQDKMIVSLIIHQFIHCSIIHLLGLQCSTIRRGSQSDKEILLNTSTHPYNKGNIPIHVQLAGHQAILHILLKPLLVLVLTSTLTRPPHAYFLKPHSKYIAPSVDSKTSPNIYCLSATSCTTFGGWRICDNWLS